MDRWIGRDERNCFACQKRILDTWRFMYGIERNFSRVFLHIYIVLLGLPGISVPFHTESKCLSSPKGVEIRWTNLSDLPSAGGRCLKYPNMVSTRTDTTKRGASWVDGCKAQYSWSVGHLQFEERYIHFGVPKSWICLTCVVFRNTERFMLTGNTTTTDSRSFCDILTSTGRSFLAGFWSWMFGVPCCRW